MTIAKFKFKKRYLLLLIFIIFLLPPLLIALIHYWQASDNDPERGALVLKAELFGENVNKIVYLEQNWKPS